MKNIFENIKFRDRLTYFEDGKEDDCVFLEKMNIRIIVLRCIK